MSAVRRNIVSLFLAQGATWMVSVVLLVIAPNEFGGEAFGQFSFAFAYVAFFEMMGSLGTTEYLTKMVAREPHRAGSYVANALRIKLVGGIVLTTAALLVGWLVGFSATTLELVAAFATGMVFNLLTGALMGGLQGLQLMGRAAVWGVVRTYVGAALGLLVIYTDGSLTLYAFVVSVVSIIPLLGTLFQMRSNLRQAWKADRRIQIETIRGGMPYFVLAVLLTLYGSADIPMLAAFAGSDTVGWYALAYRWVTVPTLVATTIATALYPALSASFQRSMTDFASQANRALFVVLFLTMPAALGLALVADDFVDLLYGDEFSSSVVLIRVLALHIPLVAIDLVIGTVALASDRQRKWIVYAAIAAAFNPLTNLAAIPLTQRWFDNGAIGAAVTTVITEMILAIGALRTCPSGVFDGATLRMITRLVGATAAMVPPLLALHAAPLVVQVAAGIGSYVLGLAMLRSLPHRELRELLDAVRVRAGAAPAVAGTTHDTAER
jgi:O-antigen/teichoic acid export membrane protein